MIGATNHLVEAPDPADVLARVERQRIDSFFAPPTVWIALANHPDFGRGDLTALTKAYYGASIMPVPVLQRLRTALPDLGFYNCFGQSEIARWRPSCGPRITTSAPTPRGAPRSSPSCGSSTTA